MKRAVLPASILALVAMTVTGCRMVRHEVRLELTGDNSTVESVASATPGTTSTERPASLPWHKTATVDYGDLRITAKVTRGTVACTITVEGQQVASEHASAGSTLECAYTVPK